MSQVKLPDAELGVSVPDYCQSGLTVSSKPCLNLAIYGKHLVLRGTFAAFVLHPPFHRPGTQCGCH
jgi:hypothetical protein